jgi:putative PEP-CTERM system TPR-repeat lipoprotein
MPRVARAAIAAVAAMVLLGCGQDTPRSLTDKARSDLAKSDVKSAVIRMKRAVQADPGSSAARALLGEALLAADDPGSAAVELTKSLDLDGDREQVMPLLARALMLSNQHRKLTSAYGNVRLKNADANAAFMTFMAMAWSLNGDKAKADTTLNAVLASSPDFAPARIAQARFAAERGEIQPALQFLDTLLARDPTLYEAWHLKGEIHTYGLRKPKAGEPFFKKALEVNSKHYLSQLELTVGLIGAGDMAGAKVQFERLRALRPDHVGTVLLQAQLAFYDKVFPQSKDLTLAVLQAQPENVSALQLLSALEWQAGAPVLAARPLETALKIDPDLANARTNLAYIYLRLGQPAKALEFLKPLINQPGVSSRALAAAAQASLQLNRLDEAEALFSRAAEASPNDTEPRTSLALTRLARGDVSAAFTQLEALASQTKEGLADSALIAARLRRGELDAALAAAQGLLQKAPNAASSHELIGRVHLARNELPLARAAFEKALSLDPRLLVAVASLAEIDLRSSQPQAALRRAEAFAKAEPGNYSGLLLLADVRRQTGASPDLERDALTRAVAAAKDEPSPRLRLIGFHAGRKQFSAASTAAQEAVAAIPNDVQIIEALGQVQLATGDVQQALTTFRSITNIDPNNAGARVRVAQVHQFSGDLNGAVAELRRAIELDPQLRPARLALVEILVNQKRTAEALKIAKEVQRRVPSSPAGYLMEGSVHGKLKNYDAAAVVYRQGLAAVAQDRDDLAINYASSLLFGGKVSEAETFVVDWLSRHPGHGQMQYFLGEIHLGLGRLDSAARQFEKTLALRADYTPAMNNLAWVLAQQRKPGGVDLARRALALEPNNPNYLDTLATALAQDGQLPEAIKTQQQALRVAPGELALRLRLARLALDAGDKALAKVELDKILAMPTKSAIRDDAMALAKRL